MKNTVIEENITIEDSEIIEAEIQKNINNALDGKKISALTFLDKLIVKYESAHPSL